MKKTRTGQAAFMNACVLLGLLVFFVGVLLALFAASATGRSRVISGGGDGANCQYTITSGTDTIVPGTTDTGNHCVWCETPITLPFPFVLYDQTFNAVNVSASGRLDFVCANDPANYLETCLPAPPNNCPFDYTIFPLWAEWSTSTGQQGCSTWANGCGIFTSISGSAPNRIFNIEWHVTNRENSPEAGNFEVRLYENHPNKRFDVIYGSITQGLNTGFDVAGVQGPTGFFTQNFCRTYSPQNVSRTYAIMTPCPTPTATSTPTPTPVGAITVTTTNDSGPGSLRQALADANDGDTINFDPALNGQTITLTTAELAINHDVTILGPGPNLLTVARSSQTQFRIFHVMPGHDATIEGLHIASGGVNLGSSGGGLLNDHASLTISNCSLTTNSATYGGAIYSDGSGDSATLAVLNSSISGNHAVQAGGGIYNNGSTATVSLMNSSVSSNSAFYSDNQFAVGDGGGIYNSGGALTITNSAVNNNLAGVTDPFPVGTGGGIYSSGTLTITNSTIRGNEGYVAGGGIACGGAVTIINSTVSGNGANAQHDGQPYGRGGGISGSVTLTNSTLSGNYASLSGGGINGGGSITNSTISGNNGGGIVVSAALAIGNTVLKAGFGANISNNGGTVTSHGYNVCSDNGGGFLNGPGDQINTDPMLGPLQDNGGSTFTHELLTGSPAIDAGDPNFTPPPYYDQRGPVFWRMRNGRIDVGSFEVQVGTTPSPTPTPTASPSPTPTATATATATATFTPTPTPTASVTATPTATATSTPRPTLTPRSTPPTRPRPTPAPRP
jgi:hypothetical protein